MRGLPGLPRLPIASAVAVLAVVAAAPLHQRALTAQAGQQLPQIASLAEAGEGLSITQSTDAGFAAFAATRGRGVLLPVAETDTAAERASVFVDLYGASFGLTSRTQVALAREPNRDALGLEHVRFRQLHMGVPVAGAEFLVHLRGARAMAANGRVLDRLPNDMTASVQPAGAVRIARQVVGRARAALAPAATYGEPRLEIFNREFLENRPGGLARLAWFVEATGFGLREFIWIDAKTGGLLLHFSQIHTLKDRQIYNTFNTATVPGTLARIEGQPATGNPDVDSAYNLAGATYDFFLNTFARDSFNGAGAALIATVNYDDGVTCPNAFWNGTQMVYCNGFATADDVVAHELTHGLTQHEANLFSYVQSGALNESYSDILGETVDLLQNITGTDTPGVRWLIGEDLGGWFGPLRNMMAPTAFSDPGKMSDSTYFWCDTNQDGGGVHTNSGVPNHAYALMVDGGTYNGYSINGIGAAKAARIQYRALTTYLVSSSGFLDNFNAVNQACNDLVGNTGISLADCSQVQNAMLAVEMNAQWGCAAPSPLRMPAVCPAGGNPTYLFQEGFEAGAGGWTTPSTSSSLWAAQNDYVASGNMSTIGPDPDIVSDHSLQSPGPGLLLPAGARMMFEHAFAFDAGFDGGVVEYSTDNGGTWLDAGALMDAGLLYDNTIIPGSDNPLANRSAFTQIGSFGFQKTRLDLATLAGQTVRFRFRVGTDSLVGGTGWFVDNVHVYTCTVAAGAPVITVPPAPQGAIAGSDATFNVTAVGNPTLRYQWLKNGVAIQGATASQFVVTNVQPVDYGYYSVIISNDAGTAASDGALLSIGFTGPPIITHQPMSRTATTGQTVQFSVDALGGVPLTYQWEVSTNGGAAWAPLANNAIYSGVTTNTLFVVASVDLNNTLYRVTITGDGSVTSDTAVLYALAANLIANGTFTSGMAGWTYYDNPAGSGQHNAAANGVFEWNRPGGSATQSVIFQTTGRSVSVAPLTAQFDLGNSGTSRKRVSVLMLDADFSDVAVCTFWLEPSTPMRTYRMRMHTTRPWANAAIYFYAASTGDAAATGGYLRLDSVFMNYDPAGSNLRTECVDPTSPIPPGGPAGPELLINGDFSSPFDSPWGMFGQINGAVNNGVFEFLKLPGTPAGVLLQSTTLSMTANQFLSVQLDLGNSSPVRKRVSVLVHDADFSDLAACTFQLPPGLPLSTYQMRLRATKAWTNATLSIYPATTGLDQWIRLDNVSLRRTPGLDINGTECLEPAEVLVPPSFTGGTTPSAPSAGVAAGVVRSEIDATVDEWTPDVDERGRNVLRLGHPIDVDASATTLAFSSLMTGAADIAEVQVTLDGETWHTAAEVQPQTARTDVTVDLSAFAGRRVWVRFALAPMPGDVAAWHVSGLRLIRRH